MQLKPYNPTEKSSSYSTSLVDRSVNTFSISPWILVLIIAGSISAGIVVHFFFGKAQAANSKRNVPFFNHEPEPWLWVFGCIPIKRYHRKHDEKNTFLYDGRNSTYLTSLWRFDSKLLWNYTKKSMRNASICKTKNLLKRF